jgi:cell division protein FtsI (penicillin-binding protein 3)
MIGKQNIPQYPARRWLLVAILVSASAVLLWRAVDLQVLSRDFLRHHGDARSLRTVSIPAHRGIIADRNGEPLAISTPVSSIWAVPREALRHDDRFPQLAALLEVDVDQLRSILRERIGREFVYLRRHVNPDLAESVQKLRIPGIHMQREYRRYYPAGEIAAHLLGFTNVDDSGQEGVELAFDHWLRGTPGSKRVLRDRLGRTVQDVENMRPPDPGKQLNLSIDRRIQYLAYRELKLAVAQHGAHSGALVVLDPHTGEVVAMAAQPSYNPNNRSGLRSEHYRNRTVTDVFEPGSTLKPFTIAAAIESGLYGSESVIDTNPGFLKVSDHVIRDLNNYGRLDLAGIIRRSSNVGASRIALALGPERIWATMSAAGLGRDTGSGFPGEASGVLRGFEGWSEVELATAAFGYGMSVTALQLARAYAVLAADGALPPVSLLRVEGAVPAQQVMDPEVARRVRSMLEAVIESEGTGQRAAVRGYRIAGKTGTVHKATIGGYAEDRYMSLFAGIAPARNPRLVMVVIIDDPRRGRHFGGHVSAPVFARVMRGALRILNVPPDDLPALDSRVIVAGNPVPDRGAGR